MRRLGRPSCLSPANQGEETSPVIVQSPLTFRSASVRYPSPWVKTTGMSDASNRGPSPSREAVKFQSELRRSRPRPPWSRRPSRPPRRRGPVRGRVAPRGRRLLQRGGDPGGFEGEVPVELGRRLEAYRVAGNLGARLASYPLPRFTTPTTGATSGMVRPPCWPPRDVHSRGPPASVPFTDPSRFALGVPSHPNPHRSRPSAQATLASIQRPYPNSYVAGDPPLEPGTPLPPPRRSRGRAGRPWTAPSRSPRGSRWPRSGGQPAGCRPSTRASQRSGPGPRGSGRGRGRRNSGSSLAWP